MEIPPTPTATTVATTTTTDGGRSRVGRPARVTRRQIAEAALAIGLERATIRSVAEYLDMSVPGLYYHVRSRDELLQLAAEHSFGRLSFPRDGGQHWTKWLLDYGSFVYDSLVEHPDLVTQLLVGNRDTLRQAEHIERVLEVLTKRGFAVTEAFDAYTRLMPAVVGAAASEIQARAVSRTGRPLLAELRRALAVVPTGRTPLVEVLVQKGTPPGAGRDSFAVVRLTVLGLAVERDEPSRVLRAIRADKRPR
jgi:AcrR family transcriptional regulator